MWNGLAAAGAASTATSTIASRSAFRSTADTLLGAGPRPHDARLGATGELHRSEPDEAVRVAEPVARALGDEELVLGLLAERLQPRGGVGGVADRRVLEAPVRADRARNDRPGVDADAHALGLVDQVLILQPGVEARQAHIEHLARGGERTLGVVGHMDRRAEHGHDAVALERDEGAAVVEHGVAHLVEPAVEDVDDLALQPLGQRREAAQVAEQDRGLDPLAGQPRRSVAAREQFPHHLLGHEPLEGGAHAPAGADLDRVGERDGPGGAEDEGDEGHEKPMTLPALKATWAPTMSATRPAAAATSARTMSRPARPRSVAIGATRPAMIAISGLSQPGGSETGKPSRMVWAAAC